MSNQFESDWERRTRRMREGASNMTPQDRASLGITHAGQKIFLDSLDAMDRVAKAFNRRRFAGSE
jgi:hypothetical protein